MWPDHFGIPVSRETQDKLEAYHALLLKWQKAINLVSPKTLDEAWVRHFADSAQLSALIPKDTKTVMDWGSGAGFPGLVLAIMNPDVEFRMVESDERKCQFMRTVSRETSTPLSAHQDRIEKIDLPVSVDMITARALAPLDQLLDYALPWAEENPDLGLLLLKGASVEDEITQAQKSFEFRVQKYQSITNPQASILHISHVHKLTQSCLHS